MSHKRVAILISGGGSNMLALVDSMTGDHPARPCLVFSNDPNARGLTLAAERGVATAALDHRPFKGDRPAFEAEITRLLEAAGTEIVCLAGFMRVLTNGFVSHWQGRMLNIQMTTICPRSVTDLSDASTQSPVLGWKTVPRSTNTSMIRI